MHPARLDMLAVRHAPARAVVRCYDATTPSGDVIAFDLECGHVSHMAPHFDSRYVTHRNCTPCGEAAVRSDPAYASEFKAACDAAIAAIEAALIEPADLCDDSWPVWPEDADASEGTVVPVMVPMPVQQQQANAGAHPIYNRTHFPHFVCNNGNWDICADATGYCASIPTPRAARDGCRATHFGDAAYVRATLGVVVMVPQQVQQQQARDARHAQWILSPGCIPERRPRAARYHVEFGAGIDGTFRSYRAAMDYLFRRLSDAEHAAFGCTIGADLPEEARGMARARYEQLSAIRRDMAQRPNLWRASPVAACIDRLTVYRNEFGCVVMDRTARATA